MYFLYVDFDVYRDEDEDEAAITDPEGKPVQEKPEDTTKSSDQSESKENQVSKPVTPKKTKLC